MDTIYGALNAILTVHGAGSSRWYLAATPVFDYYEERSR